MAASLTHRQRFSYRGWRRHTLKSAAWAVLIDDASGMSSGTATIPDEIPGIPAAISLLTREYKDYRHLWIWRGSTVLDLLKVIGSIYNTFIAI